MSKDPKTSGCDAEAEIEQKIRRERPYSLAEAIGRMAGPGAMKGTSPITRLQQAGVEIENWLTSHLADARGNITHCLAPWRQGKRSSA